MCSSFLHLAVKSRDLSRFQLVLNRVVLDSDFVKNLIYFRNSFVQNSFVFIIFLQHQLASLLKTAENLKIKGLAEVTSSSKGEGGNPGDSNRNSPASGNGNGNANGDHNGSSAASLIPTTPPKGQLISKCPFGVIVWTKIPRKKFDKFCPRI